MRSRLSPGLRKKYGAEMKFMVDKAGKSRYNNRCGFPVGEANASVLELVDRHV